MSRPFFQRVVTFSLVVFACVANLPFAGAQQQSPKSEDDIAFELPGRVYRSDGMTGKILIALIYSKIDVNQQPKEISREEFSTDEQGLYRVSVPNSMAEDTEAQISIEISCPDFLTRTIGPVDVQVLNPAHDTPIDFIWQNQVLRSIKQCSLQKGVPVSGRALLPDGSPVAGATVEAVSLPSDYHWKFRDQDYYRVATTAETDERGRFELLTFHRTCLTITAEDYAPLLIDRLGKIAADRDFQLPKAIRPEGKLVDHLGEPVPNAIVNVVRIPEQHFQGFAPFSPSTVTDENGVFRLPPIPAATYEFSSTHRLADPMQAKGVDRGNPESWRSLETSPLDVIFLKSRHQFSVDDPTPTLTFQGIETRTIKIDVTFPFGRSAPTHFSVSGVLGEQRWSQFRTAVLDSGKFSVTVPKGLEQVDLHTGVAFLQGPGETEAKIKDRFKIDKIDRDMDGYSVRIPENGKLTVVASHPNREIYSNYRIRLFYKSAPKGSDKRVSGQNILAGDGRRFACHPIANEEIKVEIRDGQGNILEEDTLTVSAGDNRTVRYRFGHGSR